MPWLSFVKLYCSRCGIDLFLRYGAIPSGGIRCIETPTDPLWVAIGYQAFNMANLAATTDAQVEKAYQKQAIFQNTKISKSKKAEGKEKRWYKDVGLGFKVLLMR